MSQPMFTTRAAAGRQLAAELSARGVEADIVLAVPRGGLPVGRAIADALDVPLDIVVARKLGAPWNDELALGAVASDGTVWYNDALLAQVSLPEGYLEGERRIEQAAASEKLARYRGTRPPPALAGKRVVVVDDGVATGSTITACLREVSTAGAAQVVLAVPVGARESLQRLAHEADAVIALDEPLVFGAVGQFYEDFDQVSDEEAMALLDG